MTYWQWLDFLSNSQMLIDFCKRGGVIMAILGALVAAPDGFKQNLAKFVAHAGGGFRRLREWLRPPAQTASPHGIASGFRSGEGGLSTQLDLRWEASADAAQKAEWLRAGLQRLQAQVSAEISGLKTKDAQLEVTVVDLRNRLTEDINRLQRQIHEKEAKSAQIDALGLLPITAGIVLSGIPEDVASWGIVGWFVWLAGAAVTLYAVISSWNRGHWRLQLSS